MNPIIKASHLHKHYGNFQALKDINFEIQAGRIIGLIGPNGAGKTTLLKSIFGLTHYEGDLTVLGLNPRKQRLLMMENMCFIADVAILPSWLKVKNALDFLEGVHKRFDREKALNFLKKTNINLESKVRELSKGMVVQLHLSLVMAIDAQILVLDEPTLGLDILYRKEFYRNLLNDYFKENRTILFTTHQVEEIENLLTDLMIINKGQIILQTSMENFGETFVQVTTTANHADTLKALHPISITNNLGKMIFIFKNQPKEMLAPYGELSTPSVSDVFVAEVTGEKK